MKISRRVLVFGAPAVLGGCVTSRQLDLTDTELLNDSNYELLYAAIDTEPFLVPAVDISKIDHKFLRRQVKLRTGERPGTIIVDPSERFAYFILTGGQAIRYGVGVGKHEAFNFQGTALIGRKAEWPHWTPTAHMISREPQRYAKYVGGMDGGSTNPLGPRALYLYVDGRDTHYRLHGTVEPWSIGTMVSSGCIRLLNQDIIDLYRRVPVGTKVVVRPANMSLAS